MDNLTDRKKRILQALIHEYIKTGKPVGSNIISQQYRFNLSPATIRNTMVELEEDGYLTQPHTSAGRIPTNKCYRFYVESIMEIQGLTLKEQERIQKEYEQKKTELNEILIQSARMLSIVSHYAGFTLVPKIEKSIISHIDLVPVDKNRILLILTTEGGFVKHKIIEFKGCPPALQLLKINRVLNERLRGVFLKDLKNKIVSKVNEEIREYRQLMDFTKIISEELLEGESEIYLEGGSNILELSDFSGDSDYVKMRDMFKLFKEKRLLADIVKNQIKKDGINVLIGKENLPEELDRLSLVTSTYKTRDNVLGVLGIIGPKRMEYERIIGIVDFISKIVNRILTQYGQENNR